MWNEYVVARAVFFRPNQSPTTRGIALHTVMHSVQGNYVRNGMKEPI